ncbi:REP-associated tyrosine transposase [Pseudomonas fontis]|uniref:Transposase n=1 Tax=Pseudomonas fontis TaxID=2942633 RepID=A0ABT5NKD2_9PSED|nr:transposase [Pseudomonas fontis]MDD0976633.1 transposase [Pseudomonas fontis]MDD0988981.1 transposase [Pseudomonas fontis]
MSRERAHGLYSGRVSEVGRAYLVTAVTDRRRALFVDWMSGRLLVREFRSLHESRQVQSMAWVVMPDHFHWLFQLQGSSLGAVMRKVKSRSSLALNSVRGETGRVWQKGYHDQAVRQEDDVRCIARYIVNNPIRAGLVTRVGDYPLWDAMWL